ncbi:hypothetical protein A2U01_0105986, partial [Trifolium medium]|nr:hypothetical protein [Trifolium medium]
VYGRAIPKLTRFLPGETKVEAVRRELVDRDECLRQLGFPQVATTCAAKCGGSHQS